MKITRLALSLVFLLLPSLRARADSYYVTVAGLGGEQDYEQRFTALAKDFDKLFKSSGGNAHVYTFTGSDASRARLTDTLGLVARDAKPDDSFVLILIGHGSFDGVEYKFNLPGADISAEELATLCNRLPAKRQLIINTSSSSGGFIPALQKPGRALIAATKAGTEKNATVFARYLLEALEDSTSDLNKDEAISAMEAFQFAANKTASFYESQKRLATEHPVFEDTGKGEAVREAATDTGQGRLLSQSTLVRIGSAQKAAADPAKRELMAKRERLEQTIDTLKYQKAAMDDDEYRKQLTAALLELARVQEELDK